MKFSKNLLPILAAMLPLHGQAAGDVRAGQALFASRCASCHSIGPSARGGFGPHLNGVLGRPAGGTADYRYSAALKNSGLVWNDASLRKFLADPSEMVPGTRMRFWGMGNQKQLDDLLAFLKSQP